MDGRSIEMVVLFEQLGTEKNGLLEIVAMEFERLRLLAYWKFPPPRK